MPGGVGYRRLGTGSAGHQLLPGSRCMIGIATEPLALDLLNVQFIFCSVFLIASSTRAPEKKSSGHRSRSAEYLRASRRERLSGTAAQKSYGHRNAEK